VGDSHHFREHGGAWVTVTNFQKGIPHLQQLQKNEKIIPMFEKAAKGQRQQVCRRGR